MGDTYEYNSGISVATDLVIFAANFNSQETKRKSKKLGVELLITQRQENPMKDRWVLPGGFVRKNIGLLDNMQCKVLEKTGVRDIYMEQLYTYGDDINRDPRGRVISVTYLAAINKNDVPETAEGSNVSKWVELSINNDDELIIPENLAFDHEKIVKNAYFRVRNKIMWTDIAFEMVGEKFTLRQLQDIHEFFIGRQIQNFQRFIGDRIIETGKKVAYGLYRPARVYMKNTNRHIII